MNSRASKFGGSSKSTCTSNTACDDSRCHDKRGSPNGIVVAYSCLPRLFAAVFGAKISRSIWDRLTGRRIRLSLKPLTPTPLLNLNAVRKPQLLQPAPRLAGLGFGLVGFERNLEGDFQLQPR